MTAKYNLVERVQKQLGGSATAAEAAVNAVVDAIADTLLAGENVTLSNFGTFRVDYDEARTGRNPQTGQVVPIPPRINVRFRVSPSLREWVNGESTRTSLSTKLPKGTFK